MKPSLYYFLVKFQFQKFIKNLFYKILYKFYKKKFGDVSEDQCHQKNLKKSIDSRVTVNQNFIINITTVNLSYLFPIHSTGNLLFENG